jgi:molecular chaperone Hsp33
MVIEYQEDVLLSFGFKDKNIKGKIVKLKKIPKELLSRFSVSKDIDKLFIETSALSCVISSNFKFDGTFKLQLNCYNAPVKVILCDNKQNGNTRSYISIDELELEKIKNKDNLTFQDLVGNGQMIFHMFPEYASEPYQAIIPLGGENISACVNNWFENSEQVTTFTKAWSSVKKGVVVVIFLQKIADNYATEDMQEQNQNDFNTVKILTESLSYKEAMEDNLEEILYNLYNEFEVLLYPKTYFYDSCSCSVEKIQEVLKTIPIDEINEIKAENDGFVKINCDFCKKEYKVQ